eukprot:651572-Pelagomonas_calceolata.AAC.1
MPTNHTPALELHISSAGYSKRSGCAQTSEETCDTTPISEQAYQDHISNLFHHPSPFNNDTRDSHHPDWCG